VGRQKVFISYRRGDAAGFSHAIHSRLVEYLARDCVFMDVHGIEPGTDFVNRLDAALRQCDVMLVLIGERWAGGDGATRSRLHDPDDWVRLEVRTALQCGMKVIPVLLDGASMPAEKSLPEDLRPLRRIQAFEVRNSRLDADMWDLMGAVMQSVGAAWPPAQPGGPIYAAVAVIYGLFAGGVAMLGLGASLFIDVGASTIAGIGLFVLNALIISRLPIHRKISDLTQRQALRIGAALHLVAFAIITNGTNEDMGFLIFFAVFPAALLYFAAFAMQRTAQGPSPALRTA
jgi:hypothetical protein